MPYIEPSDRSELNPKIAALAHEIVKIAINAEGEASFAGLLNYSCTCLALQVLKGLSSQLRYWHVALVTGVFHNISQEFYRRIGSTYENFCIAKNGDVAEIAWFETKVMGRKKELGDK